MSVVLESGSIDLTRFRRPSFGRLVVVELRKMADTRAGVWLLISTAAVTALVMLIQLWVVVAQDLTVGYRDFLIGMNTPMGVLLPVLGIMSVTSEWGQRTAMVTFTQTPSRGRVIASKAASVLVLAVAAVVIGLLLGAVANVLYGALSGAAVTWGIGPVDVFYYFLLHVFGLATGFAFGMLFLNTAAAIVLYFVYSFILPGLFGLGAALLDWFDDLQPWVDFNFAQTPLIEGDLSGGDWAHLAVSGLIWLVLPFAIGLWRVLRAEVK